MIAYGHIPLMLTERCFIRENFGCEKCGSAVFTDRTGANFPLLREYPHRNQILNGVPTYLGDKQAELDAANLRRLHLLFTVETPLDAREVLARFLAGKLLAGAVRRAPRSF